MGVYLRPLPWLKVRVSRSEPRWAIGPRAACCPAACRGGRHRDLDGRWSSHLLPAAAAARGKEVAMAANITVSCPVCGRGFGLRFDPGPEDAAPGLARAQLRSECPDHDGKKWEFWDQIR